MLWRKENSYKEFDNDKKFLRLENSPSPPCNFSNCPSLNVKGWRRQVAVIMTFAAETRLNSSWVAVNCGKFKIKGLKNSGPICAIFLNKLHEKTLSTYEINKLQHGKCFVRFLFTRLIIRIRKLTRSFSDTTQLVNKNRPQENPK